MRMAVTPLSTHLSHHPWRICMNSEECSLKGTYTQMKVRKIIVNASEITLYEIQLK